MYRHCIFMKGLYFFLFWKQGWKSKSLVFVKGKGISKATVALFDDSKYASSVGINVAMMMERIGWILRMLQVIYSSSFFSDKILQTIVTIAKETRHLHAFRGCNGCSKLLSHSRCFSRTIRRRPSVFLEIKLKALFRHPSVSCFECENWRQPHPCFNA